MILMPPIAYAEDKSEFLGVDDFLKQNKNPDITTFEWQAAVFIQCGAMFKGFALAETIEDKKSQFNFISESFIGKAAWAYAGYTSESPSSNELAFIQAWIDDRYNAFTQSYLYRIRQEISHGDDYLEGFLDDVTACNKFNEKYP